jgi:hypothetical protein
MSGVPFQQQAAQTSGNGTVLAIPPSFRNHSWIITGNGVITGGDVQLETGTDPNLDTNIWAPINVAIAVLPGVDQLVQYQGILGFVRARISAAVTGGGSVTVTYLGAKSY